MLNGIKNMINQKLAIQEAADAILRESCNMDIDDLIVLGEDSEMENPVIEEDDDDTDDVPMDKEDSPESLPGDDNNDEGEDEDDEDDEDSPAGTNNDPGESDDIMNSEIDVDIPTPVGRQTGEPVNDDIGDLMQMEIDLTSNTMSNLLPIPPSNADEAIISDDLGGKQHVDSGFGGDDNGEDIQEDNPGDAGIEESSKNLTSLLDDKTFVKMKNVITTFTSDMKPVTMLTSLFWGFDVFTGKYPDVLRDCITKDNYKTPDYLVLSVIDILEHCKCVQEVDWKVERSDFIWSIDNIAKTYGFKHGVKSDDLSTKRSGEELMYEFNQKAKDGINVYDIEIESDSYVLCLWKKDKVNELKKILNEAGMKLRSISKNKDGKLVLESVEEFTEGISLAGGMEENEEGSDGAVPEEDVSKDPVPDTADDSDTKENSVTAAVRDKINESETEEPSSTGSSSSTTKEELLKKLGSITKNLEDAKKAVMDVIN